MPEGLHIGEIRRIDARGSLAGAYWRALAGAGKPLHAEAAPVLCVSQPGVRIDGAAVMRFRQSFGLTAEGPVPPTFAHVLAGRLQLLLLTHPDFPLRVLGTVHLRNPILQQRALQPGETVDLEVRLDGFRTVARGTEYDLLTLVRSAGGDEIWRGVSTHLLRTPGSAPAVRPPGTAAAEPDPPAWTREWLLSLPADTGRRYAGLSGDWNPIHLSAWSARLFGFRRALIHGMWTYARVLAALEPHLPGEALALDVEFRRPLLLPGRARILARPASAQTGWLWSVEDRSGKTLHAQGSALALAAGGTDSVVQTAVARDT